MRRLIVGICLTLACVSQASAARYGKARVLDAVTGQPGPWVKLTPGAVVWQGQVQSDGTCPPVPQVEVREGWIRKGIGADSYLVSNPASTVLVPQDQDGSPPCSLRVPTNAERAALPQVAPRAAAHATDGGVQDSGSLTVPEGAHLPAGLRGEL